MGSGFMDLLMSLNLESENSALKVDKENLEKQVDRSILKKKNARLQSENEQLLEKIADLESQAVNSFRKLSQKTAESLESGSETGEAGWGYDWNKMHQPTQNLLQKPTHSSPPKTSVDSSFNLPSPRGSNSSVALISNNLRLPMHGPPTHQHITNQWQNLLIFCVIRWVNSYF